jgi:hypothetical protein
MSFVPPSSGETTSVYQSARFYVTEECNANTVNRYNLQNPESKGFVFAKRRF